MPDPARHTRFLQGRLEEMGIESKLSDGHTSAFGELLVEQKPFSTLDGGFAVEKVRFYTLGHAKLKFYAPRIFFELPAVDVARCTSRVQIEAALRKSWDDRMKKLGDAKRWLEELGADFQSATRGARLFLPIADERMSAAYVRSIQEIHIPSVGPLSNVSLDEPARRRHRPLRSLDHSTELVLGLEQAIERAATEGSQLRVSDPIARPDSGLIWSPRVLALDHDPATLEILESALGECGLEVSGFRDAGRALAAFEEHSYDLVLAEAHMPRVDGMEFTARLRDVVGIEKIPVVLVDDRESDATREAASEAGASAYMVRPMSWSEAGTTLVDLLDTLHVRRFVRYPLRLSVDVPEEDRVRTDLTQAVGRGGISLRTRRELAPGTIERYRLKLPAPLPPIEVDGVVISQRPEPGRATTLVGVRFVHYLGGSEIVWIRLIAALARRAGRRTRGPARR